MAVSPHKSGGYFTFIDPTLDHILANPFWMPELCPHILHADVYQKGDKVEPYIVDLDRVACEVLCLRQCPDVIHYLFKDRHKSLQICCRDRHNRHEAGEATGCLQFVLRMGNRTKVVEENLAVKRLKHLVRANSLCDKLFKFNSASHKFCKELQVMEALIHHLPYKKIAEFFFDKDRIREEISDPDSHVNNIVSYAIEVAKGLMKGDYLKYLQKTDS